MSNRWLRLLLVAAAIGLSIAWLIWTIGGFTLADAEGYRLAADRLRFGQSLYPPVLDPDAASVYRYAPWFAAAWVPIAVLPLPLGNGLWAAALLAASVIAVAPLAQRKTLGSSLLALLACTVLIWTSARGNVHPLMMVALVHGMPRRSGPIWVALAASLKAVPIVFVLVYLARRQWSRAVVTLALTALLVAPMPLLGWRLESPNVGASISLWSLGSPALWLAVAGAALVVALAVGWRVPRLAPLASSVAAILALPRLLLYDLTYLLVGASSPGPEPPPTGSGSGRVSGADSGAAARPGSGAVPSDPRGGSRGAGSASRPA